MNTSQIKSFAIQSRNVLKTGVIQRIQILGFDANGNLTKGEPTRIEIQGGATLFAGEIYDGAFYNRWMSLRERIREKGVKEVYEEAAYTWFNRLVAIRIMMKNGFIDPVLAYTNEQTRIPRIVSEARSGRVGQMSAGDREKLRELMGDDARINEQFALLIDNFCRTNPVIFNCFGGIEEYISLLLPDNILAPGGFIDLLNHTNYITDEDFKQSELIGWLYQFYISEKKDEVFDGFKKGKKAESDDIPAATQIFTPNWIVKYMVQNTIGRIYLDNNPWATDIKDSMQYLVKSVGTTPKEAIIKIECLEDYCLLDPASGSGHILIEGFAAFYQMYISEGYSSRNAIENILTKNLVGIDIDTRAKQLATFSLLMTAARIDRSFLDAMVMPRVLDMPRHTFSRPIEELLQSFYMSQERYVIDETIKAFEVLEQADNLGSIMRFSLSTKTRNEMELRFNEWQSLLSERRPDHRLSSVEQILPSVNLILALSRQYTGVVANPPYMGAGNMNDALKSYINSHYADSKADLFSVFIEQMLSLTLDKARMGCITMEAWMFLSSFERFREKLLENYYLASLTHLGWNVIGIAFGTAITVFQKNPVLGRKGEYSFLTISDLDRERNVPIQFPVKSNGRYAIVAQSAFESIPGSPIGYWVSEKEVEMFSQSTIKQYARPCKGIDTGENDYFLRLWFEVSSHRTDFINAKGAWIPYNKGGGFRKWYGFRDYLIRWNGSDDELKSRLSWKAKKPTLRNRDEWFKESFTWSSITGGAFSARYSPKGALFDNGGSSLFSKDHLLLIGGLVNSCIARRYFEFLAPTINYQPGDVGNIAVPNNLLSFESVIAKLVSENVRHSKLDWDAHETSWEFKENELIRLYKENKGEGLFMPSRRLEDIVFLYKEYWAEQFNQLHTNEEELNRQFIDIYGLQDELTPDVPLDDITILQQGEISIEEGAIVWHNDVLAKQLLSYAVGCMMGRYRLDRPGLHIAYPNPTSEDIAPYDFQGELFEIDDDGIIPLLGRDCPFDDNAYNRVVKFIRQVFGESFLNENLNFIEASLGRTIEDYFVKDFWKDHKKMYSNRPIYWLFSSKKGAFQCLTYMHRMNPYTAEAVRSKYLLPYIDFLKNKIAADMERASSLSTIERRNLDKMQKALDECIEYDEILHDVADRQIRFDLDDGVVVNYAKFGDILSKIK